MKQHCPFGLVAPSSDLIVSCPYGLVAPSYYLINLHRMYLITYQEIISFFIVSVTPFIYKPESSRDLTIFIICSISSIDIIKVVVSDSMALGS